MATTINASTSAGLVSTADTSGVLQLQTAGTTAVSVSASQVVGFTNAPTIGTLTSGRVTYAGTSGVLQDSANLTFDGSTLTINSVNVGRGAGAVSANTAVGNGALVSNSTGTGNSAFGFFSLQNSTGDYNTGCGWYSLNSNIAGASNVGIGAQALNNNLSGSENIGIGRGAANTNTSGSQNVGIGSQALFSNTTANGSTAVGFQALYSSNRTADSNALNTAIGYTTLYSLSTGQYNTAIGYQAGYNLTTGNNNVIVGYGSQASAVGGASQIVLGAAVTGQADSNVTIGSGAGKIYNAYTVNATWTQTSDARLKTNVKDDSLGLSFINRLRPVTFNWKASNEIDPSLPYYNEVNQRNTTTIIHGLIAQEVKAALDAEGCSTFNGWDAGNEDTIQAISREMFVSPLIKAIQELSIKLDEANTANSAMAARIAALEAK